MKISCIQMDMLFARPDENFAKAKNLIERAVKESAPDTVVLPETWNTGFFPRENLESLCDRDGERVKKEADWRKSSEQTSLRAAWQM